MSRILIVDDEFVIAQTLKTALAAMGYEVVGLACTGDEALEMSRLEGPDLILMDINMPGNMDGITVAELINREQDIPVIFVTGYAENDILERAKHVRPFGYIVKPFQEAQLAAAIEIAMVKNEMERQLRQARDELEQRVRERTRQLALANEKLRREIVEREEAERHARKVSRQLLEAQETERQKISRELHDGMAQDLAALKVGLTTLLQGPCRHCEQGRARMPRYCGILQETLSNLRNLSYDLRPPLMDVGLVDAVQRFCSRFAERNGVGVDFVAAGMEGVRMAPALRGNLYRLVQEGLNNIRKHARATRVTVRLVASYPKIFLRMEDDGVGFDVEDFWRSGFDEQHMGLWNMRERVEVVRGTLKIDSHPGVGTKISVEVQCKEWMHETADDSSHR